MQEQVQVGASARTAAGGVVSMAAHLGSPELQAGSALQIVTQG